MNKSLCFPICRTVATRSWMLTFYHDGEFTNRKFSVGLCLVRKELS